MEMQDILNSPLSEVEVEYGDFIETITKFIQEQEHVTTADISAMPNKDDIGKLSENVKMLAEKMEARTKAITVPQTG